MVYVKGPGLYSDIGKKARDLLYKDYQSDRKFTLSTLTSNGVAITWSGTKKEDLLLADISSVVKNKNMTTDIKVDSSSNVLTTVSIDEAAPGVKAIFSFVAPDHKSGKVEVQYLHEYAGISTSLGFTAKPTLNLSAVAGNQSTTLGTDVSFDTATGNFTKLNAALSIATSDLIASFMLSEKGQSVTASYSHSLNMGSSSVGAELTHSFPSNENTLTFGAHHLLDPATAVKARVNNFGKANALLQHEFRPKSLLTISAEVDTRAIEKSAKLGLALAIKP